MAHEIGHNLGMNHDFDDAGNGRVSERTGAACKDIGGYMDYSLTPSRWSDCSVDDLTTYYNNNINNWCMEEC